MRTSVVIPFMMIAATATAFAEGKTVSDQT
jgi:hypothetical protein